jgi:hypothetical protein
MTAAYDDALQALLGQALRTAEPVPDKVFAGARAAWTWRTIDEELAELVFDSASELTGVRSEDTARQLTFRSPGVEIEVMVVDDVSRRIVGQLIPPGDFAVRLAVADELLEVSTDRLGRFTFEAVAPGPVRISIVDPDGTPIVSTEWVLF